MRSRCTCQSGLEHWRWWAQTHGGFSSHSRMFRRMYAGCDLKATSVWHNLYVPWMPSHCTYQIGLKRSHSWEPMYIFMVLTQTMDSICFAAYMQDMPITTPPVWHNQYAPWMPSRCTCQIGLKRQHSWEPMYIFMFCTRRWHTCGTKPSNPLIVKSKENSLRWAQRGCLNVWFVRNTPMALFYPQNARLDGPYV